MLRFLLLASLVACSLGAATLRRSRLDGRIVGCRPVTIEEFPYQLSYEYSNGHRCGASIISPDWVLTSGHCVDGAAVSSSRFRAGSSIREQGGTVHPAAQIILNPSYDYWTIDFDISVARVSVPFNYGPGVQPIPLASTEPPAGSLAVVSGWRSLCSGCSLPSQLQAVDINIISRTTCNNAYANYGGITVNMMCAGVTCCGDSGGPLVVGGVQVGIVSWGVGCELPDYPGVYSNVATLRSWVTENTGV